MSAESTRVQRSEVLQGVKEVVGEQMGLDPATIQERDLLAEDLNCDSLDLVEIAMNLEEAFELAIPDQFSDEMKSIGQVTDGVLRLLGRAADA